jgi:diacylglycerol kinase family enzyme
MLVIVNPNADGGRAAARWQRIRPRVVGLVGRFDECVAPNHEGLRRCIAAALARGERRFVAAGGDGTVNTVIGDLVELAPPDVLEQVSFGAIGLGSSNDFHKPRHATIDGVPCRLDFAHPIRHDVGRTAYVDPAGERGVRHWLINASVGTTAAGNWLYNRATGIVGALKRHSASLGMVGAALLAVLRHRRVPVTLERQDGSKESLLLCNLGVVKNPHFTGVLRYDSPYEPASGDFFVHLLISASLWDTLVALARLARGRFAGRSTARTWRARRLALESAVPFAVEGDGEIVLARRVEFSLEPGRLAVCA